MYRSVTPGLDPECLSLSGCGCLAGQPLPSVEEILPKVANTYLISSVPKVLTLVEPARSKRRTSVNLSQGLSHLPSNCRIRCGWRATPVPSELVCSPAPSCSSRTVNTAGFAALRQSSISRPAGRRLEGRLVSSTIASRILDPSGASCSLLGMLCRTKRSRRLCGKMRKRSAVPVETRILGGSAAVHRLAGGRGDVAGKRPSGVQAGPI
jgi:hypothetical protein